MNTKPSHGTLCIVILATLLLISAAFSSTAVADNLMGFVCHYPFIDVGMDEIAKTGASAVIMRAVSGMSPKEGVFDPWPLKKQLDYAEKNKIKIVLLIEANPVYSPSWITEKCKQNGECLQNVWGAVENTPSMSSKTFRLWHEDFVKRVIDWVKANDRNHTIIAYQPGAEWWYPSNVRMNHLDVDAFRNWLKIKYGSIDRLNRVWGASYSRFDEATPAALVSESSMGKANGLASFVYPEGINHDVSWSCHQNNAVPVKSGNTYVFSARVKTRNIAGEGAHLSVAYLGPQSDVPVNNRFSTPVNGINDWRKMQLEVTIPEGVTRAWLLLKLRGNGECWYDDVDFRLKDAKDNLAPNPELESGKDSPDKWFFDNWTNSKEAHGIWETGVNGKCVKITVDPPAAKLRLYKNVSAANYDWARWSYEYLAGYINYFAGECKKHDPSRPTMGYLTFSFSNPIEWDYVQESAVSLDSILPACRNLDIIGMQICSADGDPMRITATIDQARKYGKPIYAIDLLDFTSGTRLAPAKMKQVTMETVKRGADGFFYYCWHGTPDYNFYPDMGVPVMTDMIASAGKILKQRQGTMAADIALIEPIMPYSFEDPSRQRNDFKDFTGVYKALFDAGYTVDVWTFEELITLHPDLSRYKLIVLPDSYFIKLETAKMLGFYVQSGGKLIRSGRTPTYDEYGRELVITPVLKALLSSKLISTDFGKNYLGSVFRTTHAGNTPPLFLETDDKQALGSRRGRMLLELRKIVDGTLHHAANVKIKGVDR